MNVPQAHFGKIKEKPVDWRTLLANEQDGDDADGAPATEDVIGMLGFDPDEENENE